ncbi:MAG TPA: ABC transporter substrate-binding protein [Marmoricola sp.]|nr:ABC transporter substrate-binding protein [Marmoricola sp.]
MLAVLVVAVLAGCGGSAISPKKAAEAQAAVNGQLNGQGDSSNVGTTTPGSTTPGSTTPGSTTPGSTTPGSTTPGKTGPIVITAPGGGVVKAGSCTGFKNGPGMTDTTIRIGNSSDITGPVPGLFTQSQQATQAFVNYFNNSGTTICGRKLALDLYDSKTDDAADQQEYTKGCSADFAMVGSMSSFDSGGASVAQNCGLPDIRAISTTVQRGNCTTCFAAQPAGPSGFETAVPDFIKKYAGGSKTAYLYISVGAAAANGISQQKHEAAAGIKFVYSSAVDVTDFNYGPYVQQMKAKGVTAVQFIAASPQFARLAQAMDQADFHPKVFLLDPSAYNQDYPTLAGSSANGTDVFMNFVPFEDASSSPEMKLYLANLNQISPGAKPGFFGVFAWSAARLFVEQAIKLGGKLTRASLIASMKTVDNWTSNGLTAPQHVGSKAIAPCWRFLTLSGSTWKPIDGTTYQCKGVTTANG